MILKPEPAPNGEMAAFPPADSWDDWVEYDSASWPHPVEKRYALVPTVCFNCEASCGLLAYIDKDTGNVRKFEGNPAHPGSRGRNCAKGPATLNQINDPDRILYPLKRVGPRGSGQWVRVSWDDVLEDIGGRISGAIRSSRQNEIMYHVGRPGEDGFMERVLKSWGCDSHQSHTNVCSSSARLGYDLWSGSDRPSSDFANARFVLLLSSHLETGHYFNPHAQRIIEAKMKGCKLAVCDTRLSNSASMADYWLPTLPGSEGAMLLAIARVLLERDLIDRAFMRDWVNWEDSLRALKPGEEPTFDGFIALLKELYAGFTPAFAEAETGISAARIVEIAEEIGRAGHQFASHVWRNTAAGNLGGWQVSRCLWLLHVLTGSVGTRGGCSPNSWDKFVPVPYMPPPPQNRWNDTLWPIEYPLSHHELSILLPHFLKDGRAHVEVYFSRVVNPVWTYPDGATWMEALRDETKVGLHVALTPTWNETAWFADYVLPMGHASERHDTVSMETHAGKWISFRQPVLRTFAQKQGRTVQRTYEVNPGEVWEEAEFFVELSWRMDPDGSLGIRKFYESPERPGEMLSLDEYYAWLFDHSVPGLPEAAAAESLSPVEFMRKYGAFGVENDIYEQHLKPVLEDAPGALVDGVRRTGFPTPSRKLEFYSQTLADYGWPEHAIPGYIRSHVHPSQLDAAAGEFVLMPNFRLPTLIHTRSGSTKWLNELSHSNPVWVNTRDARRLGIDIGDLLRVSTEIGYFVAKAWPTEGIAPGVIGCSHHLGRWRLGNDNAPSKWSAALVDLEENGGRYLLRQREGIKPFESADPDSKRIWWSDAGVHQNLCFPVQPDPLSGMHCWHQKVRVEKAHKDDRYGDVFVDTNLAHDVYKRWLAMTRPGPGPDGQRRPYWLQRPYRPAREAFAFHAAATVLSTA